MQVLERRRGLPILLCVVYQAVARRCGLELGFVNFPNHMLLCLPERLPKQQESPPPSPPVLSAAAAASLCGLWVADYHSHGPEVVEVTLRRREGEGEGGGGKGGGEVSGEVSGEVGGKIPGEGGGEGEGWSSPSLHTSHTTLEARKLTGDPFVPAGELSWSAVLEEVEAAREGGWEAAREGSVAGGGGRRLSASLQVTEIP